MDQPGFAPPDLTHPTEWLSAWGQLLHGGGWLLAAIIAFGLVLAALAWATRRDGGSVAETASAGYAQLIAQLPRAGLAGGLVLVAVLACGTLANRAHHDEQRARASILASYPDEKMIQAAPRFGHLETVNYKRRVLVDKKFVEVDNFVREDRKHFLTASDVRAEIHGIKDPVRAGRERFAVTFSATYKVANPLDREQQFYFDITGPQAASVVHELAISAAGRPLSPQAEGGERYWLTLPAKGQQDLTFKYRAEGVPRWVYDASAERLSNFKLTIVNDLGNARFASGVAPTTRASTQLGDEMTWAYPVNATITEPLGIFTAAGELPMAGLLPRWLLLAPALLGGWLLVLAFTTRLKARDLLLAGTLFASAVLVTYVLGRVMPPAVAFLLGGAVVLFLADSLDDDGLRARIVTLLALVLPGLAFAMPYAAPVLALAMVALAAWLARARPGLAAG